MSVVAILGGDWEIKFDDEFDATSTSSAVQGLKMIKHVTGTTTVTANELYSAVADAMDELNSMDDENPMLPTTPNAYTMENDYFIDNTSTEFITGGSINSVNWSNQIWCKVVSGGTPFVSTDIGLNIIESAGDNDSGTLLDYETLPDGTEVVWIRAETGADVFDETTGTIAVTGDSGTGTRTITSVATTGEQLWSNLNVIGGIAGDAANEAEVFIVQDRVKLTQFWTTDPTVSGGIVDALIRVKDSLTAVFPVIALGVVEVFNRRYGSTYDNFALDVSAGGTSSLPLATAPDLNNATGYRSMDFDGGAGTVAIGDLITNNTDVGVFGIATTTATGATGTVEYYLVGVDPLADFAAGENFTTTTGLDAEVDGAPIVNLGGPTDPAAGQGGTVTVAYGINDVDHDGDGNTEPYSITVDAQGNVSTEEVYERLKYITRRGATAADLFSTPITQAGEQFRGLQIQAQTGATGSFTEGDDITNETEATGIQAGIVLGVNSSGTYVTITDTSGAYSNGDVLDDEASDSVTIGSPPTVIVPVKASPFGTLAGGTFFGARGVVLINPASGDAQDATLTDDNGVLRVPPNTVSVEITNLVDQDVVFVADATAGVIDKDRFSGISGTPAIGSTSITVAGSIDGDVPAVGFIRIVDADADPVEEQRYRYSSRSSTVFTLNVIAGTATGGDTDTLIDTGASFDTDDIIFGDLMYNTGDSQTASVISVDNATTITTTVLTGAGSWDNLDDYTIGATTRAYTTADNIYAPILDRRVETGDGDAINNSLVETTPFGIIVNVRQGKIILPFTQNTSVEDGGRSLSVIRNDDTIAN